MRDYSKVSPQFWIGATGKKLRTYGVEAQLVAMYLLTCAHANMIGMYYLPKIYIAHECGLDLEGASKGLLSAIEAGFCSYDEASEVVWVYEMATHQIGEQLSQKDLRVKGVQNEYNAQPESPYLQPFFAKYKHQFLMTNCRGIEAPSKPLVSQEQEQEQEQEQKKTKQKADAVLLPDWLPGDVWESFKDHRKKLKKPLTAKAEELAIKQLDTFRQSGHNPVIVVNNSIMNGWQGLFEPKGELKSGRRDSGRQAAARSIFKPEHIKHLGGANQEIEVKDA